jgi:pimeloyl-ACP methyl ester carboxylesterase
VTLNPSTVQPGGSAILTVTTSTSTPPGTYAIPIYGTSGSLSQTGAAILVVGPASPASMLTPPPGATIPGGTTTFTWNSGVSVNQYNLLVGSTPGAPDYYSGSVYTGMPLSDTVPNLPTQLQPLYVTLQSITPVGAQTLEYSYTINPQAATLGAPQNPTPSQPPYVYNNNTEVQIQYQFSGGDATTLTGCTPASPILNARIVLVTQGTAVLGFTAPVGAPPQTVAVICTSQSGGGPTVQPQLVDSTPLLDSVSPVQITAGVPAALTLVGLYFGDNPLACISGPGDDSCYSFDGSSIGILENTPGDYTLQVCSSGEGDLGFVPGPDSDSCSDEVPFVVVAAPPAAQPLSISGTVISNNRGMPGINVRWMVNGGATHTTQTDRNGNYGITVNNGDNVTLWPSPPAPYTYPFTAAQGQNGTGQCEPSPPPMSCYFGNVQASQTQNFSPNYTTVFLLHGIGQSNADMQQFASSLTSNPSGLTVDLSRFVIDAGFNFSECTQNTSCTVVYDAVTGQPTTKSCSLDNGAQKLAQYINNSYAPGPIVLVGYSLGGLLARDLLASGYVNNTVHPIQGLITLGSPHWGYPYNWRDESFFCAPLLKDMAGSWNALENTPNYPITSFLPQLTANWTASSYGQYWLAAAGTYCSQPYRQYNPPPSPGQSAAYMPYTGCPSTDPVNSSSDGVVCMDSATYSSFIPLYPVFSGPPTSVVPDSTYAHTTAALGLGSAFLFCPVSPNARVLYNPVPGTSLFQSLVQGINNGQ